MKPYRLHSKSQIFGREKELDDLSDLLSQHNVISITGTGGVGKTTIGIELCNKISGRYKDGILYVSMSTLSKSDCVIPALANVLGITEAGNRNLTEGVYNIIGSSEILIFLDNLEHIQSAAQEVLDLIASCPNIRVLCTSRIPLNISPEYVYVLQPFKTPHKSEVDLLKESPAFQLFMIRSQMVNSNLEITNQNAKLIVEICHRLDGLPLAIELAAARLRILTLDQLLEHIKSSIAILSSRTRDIPQRHQTLQATIEWSYDLLKDSERKLLRRLSVFTNGFNLDSVKSICYDSPEESHHLVDQLESLYEKGLIVKKNESGRFTLLQTIKDFVYNKLIQAGDLKLLLDRHATYYAAFAIVLREGAEGKDQVNRIQQGIYEESNIAIALDHLLDKALKGDYDAALQGCQICGDLWMYWHIRGKHNSAKNYVRSFLNTLENSAESQSICDAQFCMHVSTLTLGEAELALSSAGEVIRIAKEIEDDLRLSKGAFAMAFGLLGTDPSKSKTYNDQALSIINRLDQPYWQALYLWQGGLINLINEDVVSAEEYYADSLEIFLKLGDHEGIGCAQSGLSMIKFLSADYKRALELYAGTLNAFQQVGDRPEQARILYEQCWVHLALGHTNVAHRQIIDSIQAYQEVGSDRGIGLSLNGLAAVQSIKGHYKSAVSIASFAEHLAQKTGVAIEFGVSDHGRVYLDQALQQLSEHEKEEAKEIGRHYDLNQILSTTGTIQVDAKMLPSKEDSTINPFVNQLNSIIENYLDDASFGVTQLYENLALGQMQVYRKLKAINGQTPSQLITDYRLKRGKDFLLTTDLSIKEIAYDVGFSDPNYFSRAFQKLYGLSPKHYRREHK